MVEEITAEGLRTGQKRERPCCTGVCVSGRKGKTGNRNGGVSKDRRVKKSPLMGGGGKTPL